MNRFKNILLVVTKGVSSKSAFIQACNLARNNDARLSIVEPIPIHLTAPEYISERQHNLDVVARRLRAKGISCDDAVVIMGCNVESIIEHVVNKNIDMVIVDDQARNLFVDVILGNMAHALLGLCPCPVWTVKQGNPETSQRVLAVVDTDADTFESVQLNVKTMDLATSLAANSGAELFVMGVWEVSGKDQENLSSELPRQVRATLLEKHARYHQIEMQKLLNRYRGMNLPHQTFLPRGDQAKEIIAFAELRKIDVIVLASQMQSRMSQLMFGNLVDNIIRRVSSGVLSIKADRHTWGENDGQIRNIA